MAFLYDSHSRCFWGVFLCVNLRNVGEKKKEIIHAQPLSERGERQSVRGIFCLADFHLQSGDVTFVCGNEIARQQTVGYIIPLLGFFFLLFSLSVASPSHCSSAPETFKKKRKKPVSQDQLVTSRDLWSGGRMRGDERRSRVRAVARRWSVMDYLAGH